MLIDSFYQAVLEKNDRVISRCTKALFPGLISYLKATMGACHDDCQECVQLTIIQTVSKIREGEIRDPARLMSYMMVTARNHLIRNTRRGPIFVYDEEFHYSTHQDLIDEPFILDLDEEKILFKCISRLDSFNREFIMYWLSNPGVRAEDVAEFFGLSVNATWQRKYRLVKLLSRCTKKYGY
jgi:DNA-directed RNA polymerase specialized sigma24 family protein